MSEVAGVEQVRVERAARPFEHRVVLGMRGIVDDGEEVGVAPDASAVFGGTGPSSCGAGWVGRTGYRSDDLLDYQPKAACRTSWSSNRVTAFGTSSRRHTGGFVPTIVAFSW